VGRRPQLRGQEQPPRDEGGRPRALLSLERRQGRRRRREGDARGLPRPTAPDEDWSVVDISPVAPLKAAVSLDAIREDASLADIALLKRSRLSVVPLSKDHFDRILKLGRTKIA
jgi:hypothetical protein